MCIGIWTLEHPDYALILCANRDEFLDRPTQPAQFHSFGLDANPHQILSGRDGLAGGTWLGINRQSGRVALLTNITEPSKRYNTSRGDLVSSFLLSNVSEEDDDYHQHQLDNKIIPTVDAKYAGFNLLLLDPSSSSSSGYTYHSLLVTNHGGGGPITSRPLSSFERSCGALSNGIDGVDANLWPKVQYATEHFPAIVSESSRSSEPSSSNVELMMMEHLFQLLAWQPPDDTISQQLEFRKTIQVLPVAISTASGNQPPPSALNGTRLSTVLLVRRNGQVTFIERDIWQLGDGGIPTKSDPPTERRYNFTLDIKPK